MIVKRSLGSSVRSGDSEDMLVALHLDVGLVSSIVKETAEKSMVKRFPEPHFRCRFLQVKQPLDRPARPPIQAIPCILCSRILAC